MYILVLQKIIRTIDGVCGMPERISSKINIFFSTLKNRISCVILLALQVHVKDIKVCWFLYIETKKAQVMLIAFPCALKDDTRMWHLWWCVYYVFCHCLVFYLESMPGTRCCRQQLSKSAFSITFRRSLASITKRELKKT